MVRPCAAHNCLNPKSRSSTTVGPKPFQEAPLLPGCCAGKAGCVSAWSWCQGRALADLKAAPCCQGAPCCGACSLPRTGPLLSWWCLWRHPQTLGCPRRHRMPAAGEQCRWTGGRTGAERSMAKQDGWAQCRVAEQAGVLSTDLRQATWHVRNGQGRAPARCDLHQAIRHWNMCIPFGGPGHAYREGRASCAGPTAQQGTRCAERTLSCQMALGRTLECPATKPIAWGHAAVGVMKKPGSVAAGWDA